MKELLVVSGALVSYLLGAVPFCLLLGFLFGRDIRNYGSGNTGATNLARVVGYAAGVAGLALDFLKGFAPAFWGPVLVTSAFSSGSPEFITWMSVIFGFLAIIGHCFPVYLGFDGGKGVATSLGVLMAVMPLVTGITFLFWVAVTLISGWVSLASILSAAVLPVFYVLSATVFACPACGGLSIPEFLLSLTAGVLVVARHHENIRRLWRGDERKFLDSAEALEES